MPPKVEAKAIPSKTQAIGIELDKQMVWPDSVTVCGNIINQKSHDDAIKAVKKIKTPLLIGVAMHRLPDRGVQRMVKELVEISTGKPRLILLHKQSATPVDNARKLAWFRLAEACGISAEHVITQ